MWHGRQYLLLAYALVSIGITCFPALADTSVRVQFGWLFDAHEAGFFAAKELGYYREEGLEVQMLPGGLDANAIKSVVIGAAQIGQAGGLEQVVTAWAEDIPIVAFAAIQRETPHAIVSLERSPIRKPDDLRGKTISVAFGDAAEVLFNALLAENKIPVSSVRVVPFRFDLTPLIQGQVDGVTGFSTDQPATLEVRGLKPVVLTYGAQGIHSYGYTLFASRSYVSSNETTIRKFVSASRRGWSYAFLHPDEALQFLNKQLGGQADLPAERIKLERLRALMLGADNQLATWSLSQSVINGAIDRLISQGQLKAAPANIPTLSIP